MSDDTFIKFTPISGAKNEGALCYLLEIDDAKILLDCGWTDKFDVNDLALLTKVAPQIDAVLISHSDLAHLGALPYAYAKLGLTCPFYATTPVHDMGFNCMYDICASKINEQDFTTFSMDDIEHCFKNCEDLGFSQPKELSDKCKGITITAYQAAHTLGGAVWNISLDTDNIVYAVDMNHRGECLLEGSQILLKDPGALSRSIVISGILNSEIPQPSREGRIKSLLATIEQSLHNGSSVLLPSDSAARVLELANMLEERWPKKNCDFPLILLTNTSDETIRYAKTHVSYMNKNSSKLFEFEKLTLLQKLEDIDNFPGPKVVVASNCSLETGYARDLFLQWMCQSNGKPNTLILTDRAPPNTFARTLYDDWFELTGKKPLSNEVIDYQLQARIAVSRRVPLVDEELRQFKAEQHMKAEQEAAAAQAERETYPIDESDEDDSDIELVENTTEGMLVDRYVRDVGPSGGFFSQEKSYPMFPFFERRKHVDEYGEAIQPDQYMAGSERIREYEQAMKDAESSTVTRVAKRPTTNDVPSKYVTSEEDVEVRCRLQFVDLQGLGDFQAHWRALERMAPRKLILVRNTEEATMQLARKCLELDHFTRDDVFTPSIGEVLNVSATTNAYRAKLTDALVKTLLFTSCGGSHKLARVSGQFHFDDGSTTPWLDANKSGENTTWEPSLHVGDVQLTDFKKVLQREGINSTFKGGGVLVCNDQVAVRKTGRGQLMVEGSLSPDYYKIRSLLYNQHAVL